MNNFCSRKLKIVELSKQQTANHGHCKQHYCYILFVFIFFYTALFYTDNYSYTIIIIKTTSHITNSQYGTSSYELKL